MVIAMSKVVTIAMQDSHTNAVNDWTFTVYPFNELVAILNLENPKTAKDVINRVLNKFREHNPNVEHGWWDTSFENFIALGALFGVTINDIMFGGFHSQGSGASFTGTYEYKKGGLKAVMAEYPLDIQLHNIVRALQRVQRRNFYKLRVAITHRHSYTRFNAQAMAFDVVYKDTWCPPESADTDDDIGAALMDFANWIYNRLEDEYNYLISDEVLIEHIENNDYLFHANGVLYRPLEKHMME